MNKSKPIDHYHNKILRLKHTKIKNTIAFNNIWYNDIYFFFTSINNIIILYQNWDEMWQ